MYDILAVSINIKNARLLRNYSQDYLALRLKISQNAYSKIERGHTRVTLDRLKIIADVLDVDLATLVLPGNHPDVEMISRIPMVPKLLEVVCRTTGMGFSAISRVTENKWIACSVHDEIEFGIFAGDDLKSETTMCRELMQSGRTVVIEDAATDAEFSCHHAVLRYKYRSFVSTPIVRQDGTVFGTLCAVDNKSVKLNREATIQMFKSLADLISLSIDSVNLIAFAGNTIFDTQSMLNKSA